MPAPDADVKLSAMPSDADLTRLLDHERQRQAADERRHVYWARRIAEESGSFTGILLDLAERGEAVVATTTCGRPVHGRLQAVGADHVTIVAPDGTEHLVSITAISSLRSDPHAAPTVGDRVERPGARLPDAIRALAVDRQVVTLRLAGGQQLRGRLATAGTDVVRIVEPGSTTAYVPMAAVAQVTVR